MSRFDYGRSCGANEKSGEEKQMGNNEESEG